MLALPTIDTARRQELLRVFRRAAVVVLPTVVGIVVAGLLAWTMRRQLDRLVEGLVIEPEAEETGSLPDPIPVSDEPYEVGEITPA
jgi:hypothetical protein